MGNPLKILIVEDEMVLRETVRKILSEAGYLVTAVETGAAALAAARGQEFDVALLDVKLPDTSGVDVLEHIKQMYPRMEAVVMTAYEVEDAIHKAFALGVHTCLRKPFEVQTLLAIFAQLQQNHGQ